MVHFAGRKAVGESVSQPMLYYTHNVVAAVNLIEAMRKHSLKNVRGILWRSGVATARQCVSATVLAPLRVGSPNHWQSRGVQQVLEEGGCCPGAA